MSNTKEDALAAVEAAFIKLASPCLLEDSKKLKEVLGYPGRMMSGSKSWYSSRFKFNVPIFNANVFTEQGKVWYGDLDITLDEEKLIEAAKVLQQSLYILYEMDGRFENEGNPKLHKYLFKVDIDSGRLLPGASMFKYTKRASRGKLKDKIVYRPEFK